MAKLVSNKKAYFHYEIIETYEAGIKLLGTEIKSLRHTGCNLSEAYVRITRSKEAFLYQVDIPGYAFGNRTNHDPRRPRKLLLHKREIQALQDALEKKQLSCVPIQIHLKRGLGKVLIGVGKPKKTYDKRHSLKKKDAMREVDRVTKSKNFKQ